MNSINNMSENKMEVKARIVSAEDGSIKVVFFSAPESPPLLGAKAVRVRLSQSCHLLPTWHSAHVRLPTHSITRPA